MVCHHSDKFDEYRHSDSGDLMFSIYHVTLRDHMYKALRDYGRKSLMVSHHLAIFAGHWSS